MENKDINRKEDRCAEKDLGVTSQKDLTGSTTIFGPDLFKLASKAHNDEQKWMKSTKVCNTPIGCFVQVSTQNKDNVAEAVTFVHGLNYDFEKGEFIEHGFLEASALESIEHCGCNYCESEEVSDREESKPLGERI